MKGLNNRDRVHQIKRWLLDHPNFRPHLPVKLRVVGKRELKAEDGGPEITHDHGDCYYDNKFVYIRVAGWTPRHTMIETLLHEWAHAISIVRSDEIEDLRLEVGGHDSAYWVAFGRLYRAYYEDHGWEESRNY